MLNRHFLRAKALQSLYAYQVSNSSDKLKAEKDLLNSLNKLFDLQVYLYSVILEIQAIAIEQIEEGKQKYFPTEEEKNPNLRFVENKVFEQLNINVDLQKEIMRLKISWAEVYECLKAILIKFKKSESYQNYMSLSEKTYNDDKTIIVQLFKNYIIKNEQLFEYLCEKELNWECDYEILVQYFLKFLKDFKEDDNSLKRLPRVFEKDDSDDFGVETDKEFLLKIFHKTIDNEDELEPLIAKRIQNWELDRVAVLDTIILKMGLVELMYCPTIPVRVTLNEYIELSKEFSTEKSKLFVNGLLDKLVIDLRALGKINKVGQGLETLEEYE